MKENHGWDFSVSRFLLANTNAGSFSVRCIGKAGVRKVEEEEEYFHFFCWKRRKNDILKFDMNDDDKGNGFHKFFKAMKRH